MKKGFTLIELMIVIAIIGIVAAIALGPVAGRNTNSNYTYGINGISEERCISGFKFVVGQRGYMTQILDQNGHGVTCQ